MPAKPTRTSTSAQQQEVERGVRLQADLQGTPMKRLCLEVCVSHYRSRWRPSAAPPRRPTTPTTAASNCRQGFCAAGRRHRSRCRASSGGRAERRRLRLDQQRRQHQAAASSRCTTRDGDGKIRQAGTFGDTGGTGIALRNGYLYLATPNTVVRYKLAARRADARAVGGSRRRQGLPGRAPARGQRGSHSTDSGGDLRERRCAVERVPAARSPAERSGSGSVSAARDKRRHLAFRREQARDRNRNDGKRYVDRHASDGRPHVARQLAVGGDAQPRQPRHPVAGQVHGGTERAVAGGVSRPRRRTDQASAGHAASTTTPRASWSRIRNAAATARRRIAARRSRRRRSRSRAIGRRTT